MFQQAHIHLLWCFMSRHKQIYIFGAPAHVTITCVHTRARRASFLVFRVITVALYVLVIGAWCFSHIKSVSFFGAWCNWCMQLEQVQQWGSVSGNESETERKLRCLRIWGRTPPPAKHDKEESGEV